MIKIKDLNFCGSSVADTFGRVFEYGGEYYRLVYKGSEAFCRELLESELFHQLVQKRYIPHTTITYELQIEGNPLILKHEACCINKPYEWSFEMYKDAAIHILKVNELCGEYGFELKDAHPFNITFHNGKPVFIDIGSITKKSGKEWCAQEEFLQITCLPLLLWANGEYCIARHILESNDMYAGYRVLPQQTFFETPFFRQKLVLGTNFSIRIRKHLFTTTNKTLIHFFCIANKISKRILKKKPFHISTEDVFVNPTIDYLSNLTLKRTDTEWGEYQNYDKIEKHYPRFVRIIGLIREHCPEVENVIDLAGNGGNLAILLHRTNIFKHILTVDYDGSAADKAYTYFKSNGLPIDSLYTNVIYPFDPLSFYKRVQSDIVIACALTHHLILRQGIPLYAIFEKFSFYTKKYIVIEFMPLGLWDGHDAPPIPDWYTEDWFRDTFEKYFTLIHQEQLESNRILFIGKK